MPQKTIRNMRLKVIKQITSPHTKEHHLKRSGDLVAGKVFMEVRDCFYSAVIVLNIIFLIW